MAVRAVVGTCNVAEGHTKTCNLIHRYTA